MAIKEESSLLILCGFNNKSSYRRTSMDGARKSHQIIVNNLPNNKILKGVVANRLLNGLKGYSPADAVQDFKNHSKYALKYGGHVYTGRNSHIEKEGGKIR